VLPTRVGRTGVALTADGRLQLHNAAHTTDLAPLEDGCPCPACRGYTRAYLRHLFKAGEMLGPRLVSLHNITFMARLVTAMREAIFEDRFAAWSAAALARYKTAW
jgi:queuine tRNA-ribosyltransferase